MAAGLFRLVSGMCRTVVITNTAGSLAVLFMFVLGGFILPKGNHPLFSISIVPCCILDIVWLSFLASWPYDLEKILIGYTPQLRPKKNFSINSGN
jgi:hypothetical protein